MNINLREEAVSEYILLYRNYLEDIQNLNKKVIDVFDEVIKITKYDKLQEQIFKMIDVYNETIINKIEAGVFSAWEESDGSLQACLKTYRAGDAANEICVQIQLQMKELLTDILEIEERERIITDRPIVSDDELERLEEICKSARREIDELKTDYLSQIESKNVENDIYGTLKSLVKDISINIEAFFEASLNSFIQLQEFIINSTLQSINVYNEPVCKENSDMYLGNKRQDNFECLHEELEYKNDEKKDSGKFDNVIKILRQFTASQCLYKNLRETYDKHITNYRKQLGEALEKKTLELEKSLGDYHKQLEIQLKNRHKEIDTRYIKGTISLYQAQIMFAESCNRADQLYASFAYNINFQKQNAINIANIKLVEEKKRLNIIVQKVVQQRNGCKKIYEKRDEFISRLENGEDCLQEIRVLVNEIRCEKNPDCKQFRQLKQTIDSQTYKIPHLNWKDDVSDVFANRLQYTYSDDDYKSLIGLVKAIYDAKYDSEKIKEVLIESGVRDEEKQNRINKFARRIREFEGKLNDEKTIFEYIKLQYEDFNSSEKVDNNDLVEFILLTMPNNMSEEEKKKVRNQVLDDLKKYSGVKCNNYTNFDEKYRKILQNRKENAEPIVKRIFEGISEKLVIINDEWRENAHYSPRENGVYMNTKDDFSNPRGAGTTFYHELGHMIDYRLAKENNLSRKTISEDADFSLALEKDKKYIIENLKKNPDAKKILVEQLKNNRLYHSLSDIIGGMKIHHDFGDEKQWGNYGHCSKLDKNGKSVYDESYWCRPYALEKETFAHLYEAFMGSKEKQQYIKNVLPNTYNVFLNMLRKYGGQYES